MQQGEYLKAVQTDEEAAYFVENICQPAANLLAGGDFEQFPADTLRRAQEFMFDQDEGDFIIISFSATKIYEGSPSEHSSVVYEFNCHSAMPNPETVFRALSNEMLHYEQDMEGDPDRLVSAGWHDDEEPDDEDKETQVFQVGEVKTVIEEFTYTIDSEMQVPDKTQSYAFVEDGEMFARISANGMSQLATADTVAEEELLFDIAERCSDEFHEADLVTIFGILGRLGLLVKQ